MDIIMATSITVTKKVPAGTPTQLFTTGASESASMTLSVFGQQANANIDIKILPSSYSIPENRFVASNFSKVATHTGGALDSTWTYHEETLNGTTYKYISNGSQLRLRNTTTNLFGSSVSFNTVVTNRESDAARGAFLTDYYTTNTITLKTGTVNKLTDLSTLTTTTRSGFYRGGNGAYAESPTGFAITCDANGYITTTNNLTSGTINDYTSGSTLSIYYYANNYIAYPYQIRMWVQGNYVYAFIAASGARIIMKPISEFISPSGTWSNVANMTVGPGWGVSSTDTMANNGYQNRMLINFGGAWYITYNTSSQENINYQMLNRVVINPTTGGITSTNAIYLSGYGYGIDATFTPVMDLANNRIYFKIPSSQGTRYFYVTNTGTVVDAGTTAPTAGLASTPIPNFYQYNAKTLAQNYANYNQYKFTNGLSDTDGLAYYTDGTGNYDTNGQSFWTKDGKYTLIQDNTLTKLDAVSTDDYWFDKQFAAAKGVRVEYTGITLAPSQSFWITSPTDIQVAVFGFKE